jgi:hypothetical protein
MIVDHRRGRDILTLSPDFQRLAALGPMWPPMCVARVHWSTSRHCRRRLPLTSTSSNSTQGVSS